MYRIGDYQLDPVRRELRCGRALRRLEPQVFDTLLFLVENRARVVSKDDLVAAVWNGRFVSDAAVESRIKIARRAVGDDGRSQKIIRTIPRRGFRFVATVESVSDDLPPEPVPDGRGFPSIAVLPFTNMSGDPEQDYFSDGMTEDIVTDLSKVSGLFVVARATTSTYRGQPVKIQQVSEDLGVEFILEGSVRKAGTRVRVTAQLVEGKGGGHVWADRYDRDLTDIFAIQDEIAHSIVDQLKVKLLPEERKAIDRAPTENLEAYTYYLRGRQFLHRHSRSYYILAKRMFAKAVELDPVYARAYAGIADCDSFLFLHYNADVSIDGILATSAKALDLDSGLAEAHASRGVALSLRKRYQEAMAEFDQATTLDPLLFEAHYFYARACFSQGKLEAAARHFQRAADINPDDYQALLVVTGVYRGLGREHDMTMAAREGVARAERALTLQPENPRPAYLGALGLATLGAFDRAKEWAGRALAIDPEDGLTKYNVACFYSLAGEHERAIDLLVELLPSATHERKQWVKHDSDLDPIRCHPRFGTVLDLLG